ncbi:MAG: adenosylcobinamide-GDP ribazoletransferase [Actinobacteria bacterium]|nr:adenosylcobinamide-GDP ribazoletransferase [Actinomycetota bacterium]
MLEAFSLLSLLGTGKEPSPSALWWFPVVGTVLGLAVGGSWWLAAHIWSPLLAGGIAVLVDLFLTGMLHFDGVVDAADGLLSSVSPEQRLSIMADARSGAFGVAAGVMTILFRWIALSMLTPAPFLIAGIWVASRTCMAGGVSAVPYARTQGGMVSKLIGLSRRANLILVVYGIVLAGAFGLLWQPERGVIVIGSVICIYAIVQLFSIRRIGGFTGDVLGAGAVVAETVGLLLAGAHWR